jgi:hypothetical protein
MATTVTAEVRGHASRRSRLVIVTLLGALCALLAGYGMLALRPAIEPLDNYDISFDPGGPIAQRFQVRDIEGWLTRMPDGTWKAYSAADPGRRCRVEYIGTDDPRYTQRGDREEYPRGFFIDRCFYSMFTLEGSRTFGPAPRGLDEFVVNEVRDGRAFLDLSRMRLGTCGEGVRAGGYCSLPDRPEYRSPSTIDPDLTARFPWPLY